jgi:7-cyano-7-deazaguanine reductase
MKVNPLGKTAFYGFQHNPDVLFPIARERNRTALGLTGGEFSGFDFWNAYELSWLNPKGKPEARILQLVYSANSLFMVESKSFKLYLNGFTMTTFESEELVSNQIKNDLTKLLEPTFLKIALHPLDSQAYFRTPIDSRLLLDRLDVDIGSYLPDAGLLRLESGAKGTVERFSNLFKANCPVTGQPDWATIYIKYKADKPLEDASLLRYIISYRNHAGYHESCCEQIFRDLDTALNPEVLTVKCFFTRRGGIDITPVRSKGETLIPEECFHHIRQ